MTIEIPPDYQAFVTTAVASGQFQSEEKVVEEALRLMSERNRRREEFRRQVQIGTDQLQRGEYTDFDDESLDKFFDELNAEDPAREIEEAP